MPNNTKRIPVSTDEALVYRRIPPNADRVKLEDGKQKPTSANFKDGNEELSVYLASETTPEKALDGHEGFGLVELKLSTIRTICINVTEICRDDEDPANGHVLICGKITNSQARSLANAAVWVVNPAQIETK